MSAQKAWPVTFADTTSLHVNEVQGCSCCLNRHDKLFLYQVTIGIELWDSAASSGVGRKLGQASIALDLHDFEPFKAQSATVELMGREKKASGFPVRHSICKHMRGVKFAP